MYIELIAAGLLGAVIGSFLNVCIHRIPRGESIAFPPSHCPHCMHRLGPLDLVPLASWLWLKGSCRYCSQQIAVRYPLVELATALLFAQAAAAAATPAGFAERALVAACLVVIFFIDLEHQLIFHRVLAMWLLASLLPLVDGGAFNLNGRLVGAGIGGGFLLLLYIITRGGIGEGDVKMSLVAGWWLGFPGAILYLFISFLVGGVVAATLLAAKIKGRRDPIPFGPFLCTGAWVACYWGQEIWRWYWR